jgi:hypothetical protein
MARLHIALVLELYQPPTQGGGMLERVTHECYAPLAKLLAGEPRLRVTLSFTRSLSEGLKTWGLDDVVITAIAQAVARGNVELAHSGAYHSVFPLLSDREVRRQVELDLEAKGDSFGPTPPRGILPPELCYHDRLLPLFRDLGFRWTLVDDKLLHSIGIPIPRSAVYRVQDLAVLFRSDLWSDSIRQPWEGGGHWTGRAFAAELAREARGLASDAYKVLMLPGETFGHHIPWFQETFLRDLAYALADYPELCLSTVSELLDTGRFPETPPPPHGPTRFEFLPPSSLATRVEDWDRGDPYPHFNSGGNPIHKRLWRLTKLILRVTDRLDLGLPKFKRLRGLLDSAFYSGQYFHASLWYWDLGPVLEGIDRQMRVLYEYARVTGDHNSLSSGQRVYASLLWEVEQRRQAEARKGAT